MIYRYFFLVVFFISCTMSWAMENMQEVVMNSAFVQGQNPICTIDLKELCSICREPLEKRKGATALTYCKHAFHVYCYGRVVNHNSNQLCFCGCPLFYCDPEVHVEIIANQKEKEKNKPIIEKIVSITSKLEYMTLDFIVKSYLVAREMYESAYDQYND